MGDIKIEFTVQMKGEECAKKVRNALENFGDVDIDVKLGRVIISTTTPWTELQDLIEKTGRKAVLSGYGGHAAVAMIQCENIKGVVRFSALDQTGAGCVVDGCVDGLEPGLHGIHIHECGDLSEGCKSVGNHYNPRDSPHGSPNDPPTQRHAGDLGNIRANEEGRATFRFIDQVIDIGDIIGRSVVVSEKQDDGGRGKNERSLIDGNCGERIACGIIARAAGILQNYKKICFCDGVTLWDERNKPLAGGDRNMKKIEK